MDGYFEEPECGGVNTSGYSMPSISVVCVANVTYDTLPAIVHTVLTWCTCIGMLRPMYYEFPWSWQAYSGTYNSLPQYMLGESVLIAPPHTQLSDPGNLTSRAQPYAIWIPSENEWVRVENIHRN